MDYASLQSEELIRRCVEGGAVDAWQEFIRRFHPLILRTVVRVARRWGESSPQVYDDLAQDTYLKLCDEDCRLLRQFDFRHPDAIFGYVKVVAASVAHDHFRVRFAEKRGAGWQQRGTDHLEEIHAESRANSREAIEQQILLKQIDSILKEEVAGPESDRNRRVFWLYYRQGLTAAAIASIPSINLTVKGVESTLHRITRGIRERIANRRSATRSMPPDAGMQGQNSFS